MPVQTYFSVTQLKTYSLEIIGHVSLTERYNWVAREHIDR
jgi:hypothetical protein